MANSVNSYIDMVLASANDVRGASWCEFEASGLEFDQFLDRLDDQGVGYPDWSLEELARHLGRKPTVAECRFCYRALVPR